MDEERQATNETKKEKSKLGNAVVLFILLVISLLIVVGLVIAVQLRFKANEMAMSNDINLNNNENIQNIQNNTEENTNKEEINDKNEEIENKTEIEEIQDEKQEKVKVDFDELVNELYNKSKVNELPRLTAEERVSYEKEWNASLDEMIKENEKLIKKKYPSLSDNELRTYAIQFTEYIKEDMFRITKSNKEIKDKAESAVSNAELAEARANLSIKISEVMVSFYNSNPGQSYKANESDLKILQQHVLQKSGGKYTVRIREDKTSYEVVVNTN